MREIDARSDRRAGAPSFCRSEHSLFGNASTGQQRLVVSQRAWLRSVNRYTHGTRHVDACFRSVCLPACLPACLPTCLLRAVCLIVHPWDTFAELATVCQRDRQRVLNSVTSDAASRSEHSRTGQSRRPSGPLAPTHQRDDRAQQLPHNERLNE